MVMGGHTLHPELVADVSGAVCGRGLRAEDAELDEVAGCSC